MASQYDPRIPREENLRTEICPNTPDPHILRTSETLCERAEIPRRQLQTAELAPRSAHLFACLQSRYG